MGAPDYDPFAAEEELPPIEHLKAQAELLDLVRYWRTEAERLADDYARLENHKRRIYIAKKKAQ